MHRRHLTLVLVAWLAAVPLRPAYGDSSGDNGGRDGIAWANSNEVGAAASTGASSQASGPTLAKQAGSTPPCTYQTLPADQQAGANDLASQGFLHQGPRPGTWVRQVCIDSNGNSTGVVIWAAQPTPVDPAALAQQALQLTAIPTMQIDMNPPPERGEVTNFESWLWVTGPWEPVNAQATAGPVTVTTTATPDRVVWNTGDGHKVVCSGPGTPYDPSKPPAPQHSDCTYTWPASSARQPGGTYTVTATVEWHATWTATEMGAGGDLGLVNRSSSLSVRVTEIQALNNSPTGG
jgi:hypothetical protein